MRGNSLSFFKPPVFVKTILLSCAFFASMFFNSCKQLTSFDPNVDGVRVAVSNAFSAPTDLKATHGRKQMISLEWTPVSGAKYYDVYCAESATAEFKKIGGTDKNSFDDKVGAGRTLYYRVCATKSDGTQSELSATVKGTSLAQPVISGGDVEADSATISWFMENARAVDGTDNYESSLMFVVHWQQKNGGTPNEEILSAKEDFKNSFYEHKIENLSGAADYEFWIDAYLSGDQSSVESSPRVDKKTLTSYTPLAPVFTASQGESAKGILLYITLPEKVMVQTETKLNPNEKVDEPYPLYFEIYRKVGEMGEGDSDADWGSPVCERLYCNGTTTPPTEDEYNAYNAGAEIKWFDESANLVGGEKYTYRIISHSDTENYDKIVCPEGKKNNSVPTPPNKATTALGWKSAHPDFNVKTGDDGGRTLSADKTKVVSVSFGFSAEWNDLGKAGDYKFAIKQNRTPWGSSSGTDSWLKNGETVYFDTLDAINSLVKTFGSESGGLGEGEKGSYSYTLYIVSKNDNGTEGIESESNVLDSMTARDRLVVTEEVNLPKAELAVQDGYKGKVVLKILTCEPGVTYSLERTKLVDGKPDGKETILTLSGVPESGTFNYDDTDVENNCNYSYILKAETASKVFALSKAQAAETLGTPKVSFNSEILNYDSVKISFDDVLAAKSYVVKLGAIGGFGGGKEFIFEPGFAGSKGNAEISLEGKTYIVIIKGPDGYDNATLAGMTADLTVTAQSGVDGDDGKAQSVPVQVNVLGPARLDAKVNTFENATEDSISLTWKMVDGAKGYLIRRVMYKTADSDEVYDDSEVTYYCDGEKVTYEGADTGGRATISKSNYEKTFTLTDTYKEPSSNDPGLESYEEAQAKIAWGLPFKYVVLPVLDKTDFDFDGDSLVPESGKVAYTNLAPTYGAATFGYGLNVHAKKSESVTTQNVTWEKPFYGANLTPKVYRRKFANNDKDEWEAVDSVIKDFGEEKKPGIDYSPSGEDRYCAWEYVVKYRKDLSDKIAPSYLEWLKDNAHDETDYDYGTKTKEKLNKGYLLAMNYSAKYGGGENPSKTALNYYSEDVTITPWYYSDRTLGPDKVELKVLSLDLKDGWQLVGTLDPEITSFENALDEEDDDTTVNANLTNKVINLKPTGISKKENATGTTNGPLKILRSAKHYYGLNLSRGENEQFDCKNYEEYAYRQITDEELIKSTMLVLVSLFKETSMSDDMYTTWNIDGASSTKTTYAGYDGSTVFRWGQGSNSKLYWQLSELHWGWKNMPCAQDICEKTKDYYIATGKLKHFMTIADRNALTSTALRGYKSAKVIQVLATSNSFKDNANYIPFTVGFDSDFVSKVGCDKVATVYFTADVKNGKFWAYVNESSTLFEVGKENIRSWIPYYDNVYYNEDSTYGWWDN